MTFLPRAQAPAVDSGGRFTRETYDALRRAFDSLTQRQAELSSAQEAITAILQSLGAADVAELTELGGLLEGKQDASDVLDALAAITGSGIVARTVGGFSARTITGAADQVAVANGSGASGNPTVSLSDLADAGTGTFKLLTRDAKGRLSGTADGDAADVPYDNTSSGLSATDVQAAVDELAGAAAAWALVKKTADESRNTTTTFADDAALTIALAANTTYRIRARVFFTVANATMDFQYQCAYSGTHASAYYRRSHTLPGAATGTDNETTLTSNIALPATGIVGTGSGLGQFEFDLVINTTTAGTFSIQWAQATSDAANATVLKGSSIEYTTI